ncbi:MAG: HEAT repeat domain-containing protein [Chloroflexi bacterium]|nr:HEAT repeat domain-containing protein [Chloroflexota bacterium]MCY3582973.1 HEAT repeat domain-containing protein [Chloroflexota bacterium]MCY3716877.1 HEAT repeat domain-containing protein [Chloroflexota bacterium]MDE2649268.1 HEAT repeat domain-containing protein [Chloroflexota bacterium]MXX49668.1 HEAT repeat domain-containing protein [Chloroflexota bacterium]
MMDDPANNIRVRAILSELRDVNKARRRSAVMKLGMVGGEQALRTLMRLVENQQEDLIVRGRAALMLGKLKDERAVPHLIRALDAPGFLTPYHAAQALGKIGDPRAITALQNFAAGSRDKTRSAAVEALRQLGQEAEFTAYDDVNPPI